MAEDEINPASSEYIAKAEITEKDKNLLPIPLPPDHVMRSAFLTAIKYRSVQTALTAYNSCIRELTSISRAQSSFHQAQLEEQRTVELLKDASTIHEADQLARDTVLLKAKQDHEQLKHEAYLAEKKREVEKHNADIQHAHLINAGIDPDEKVQKSQADQEMKEYLESKVFKMRKEKSIAEEIRKEHQLTQEEEAILNNLVDELSTNLGG